MINNNQKILIEKLLDITFTRDYVYFNRRTYRSKIKIKDTNIVSPKELVEAINLVHNFTLSFIINEDLSSDNPKQNIFCLKDCRETYLDTLEEEAKIKAILEEKDQLVNEYFKTIASVLVEKFELMGEILLLNKENYLKAAYLERHASSLSSQLDSDFYDYQVKGIIPTNITKFENGSNFCAYFFRASGTNYWNTNVDACIGTQFEKLKEKGLTNDTLEKIKNIVIDLKEIMKDLYSLRVNGRQYVVQYKYQKDYNNYVATNARTHDLRKYLKDRFFFPKYKVGLFQAQLRLYLAIGNQEVIDLIKDIR